MRRQFLKCSIICLSAMGALCDALTSQAPTAEVLATGVVEGIVRGPLGEAMPNAEVLATRGFRGSDVIARTRSDGSGMFVIGGLAADGSYEMQAKVDGYTVSSVPVKLDADGTGAHVELRVYEAHTVCGRVIDPAGKPVAGAVVIATKDHANVVGGFVPPESATDEQGLFQLSGVPIGSAVVRAWASGFEMRQHWLNEIDDVDIEMQLLDRPGARMEIHIDGLPKDALRDVLVYTQPRSAMPRAVEELRVDESGAVTLTGLPRMTWNVRPELHGYVFSPPVWRAAGPVNAHAPRFSVVREDAFPLHGVLLDEQDTPLVGQRLQIRSRERRPAGEVVTEQDGVFETTVGFVDGQPFSLMLEDPSWTLRPSKLQTPWMAPPGQWTGIAEAGRGVVLRAVPAGKVEVRVVDRVGRPVPFQVVALQAKGPNHGRGWVPLLHATTGRDGRALFERLTPADGDHRVFVGGARGYGESDVFAIGTQPADVVEVKLVEASSVSGRVVNKREPVAGICVSFAQIEHETTRSVRATVLTDREGRFVFCGVGAGEAAVGAGAPLREKWSEPFEVTPGKQADVEIVVGK